MSAREILCPWCQKKVIIDPIERKVPKAKRLTFGDGVQFGLGLMFSVWLAGVGMVVLWVLLFGNPLAGLL